MNYAESGRDLLLELQQSETSVGTGFASVSLPPYNTGLVRTALQDWQLHLQALEDQIHAAEASVLRNNEEGDGGVALDRSVRPSIKLHEASLERLKRCLLAYHKVRLDRLQQVCFWQRSGSDEDHNAYIQSRLSPSERDFLSQYEAIVQEHVQTVFQGNLFDIRAFRAPPAPVDRVQVRVIDTAPIPEGPIVLESGAQVWLRPGSTHFLAHRDVEEYIRQGLLRVVLGEEEG
jgi:hypothetical protein